MDFSAEGILKRMKKDLKNEDTKMEGSFSMDNLQAVAEELARIDAMRIAPLMDALEDKEDNMGTSGNEKHYVRWAKEATGSSGERIVGSAKVKAMRDGTGLVSIAVLTKESLPPSEEEIAIIQRYIDSQRPIGAKPIVSAAEDIAIRIFCNIKCETGYTVESVYSNIQDSLKAYMKNLAFQSGLSTLNYYTIGNLISDADGVAELEELLVNGGQESITAAYNQYFALEEVVINGSQQ